ALKENRVAVATIDDKVRRILRKAIEFGFFDRSQTDPMIPTYSQEGRAVALQVAREGMVLLKNHGNVLPLDKTKVKKIAVIGPDAFPAVPGGGGSSQTKPFNSVSYLEGISNYLGSSATVLYDVDTPPLNEVFEHSDFVTEPNGVAGLKADYFANDQLQGTPAMSRTDNRVEFNWGSGSFMQGQPSDHYSVRWQGYFIPKTTGDYKFYSSA